MYLLFRTWMDDEMRDTLPNDTYSQLHWSTLQFDVSVR